MYNILSDMNALYEAFKASVRGSKWKRDSQLFGINVLPNLASLKREVENRTYSTEKGTEFKHNERGKIRHIHGASVRDRTIRHCLCDNILGPNLARYLIHNNGASQKGKGLAFTRQQFERDLHNFWLKYRDNDGYVGFLDLSKFYDNIRHDEIRKSIMPKIPEDSRWLFDKIIKHFEVDVSYMSDEEFSRCLDKKFNSVEYYETIKKWQKTGEKFMKKSVEIGDQVSQDIGVFFPTPLDNYAKIVRSQKWYGRYMDDIYLICRTKEEVQSVFAGIKEQAEKIGLYINDNKTRIVKLSSVYKFLQIKYTLTETGKVIKRVNPANVTRERRKIKAYKRLLDNKRMSYNNIEQSVKSWIGSYAKIMSKKQIQNMKALYEKLFGKELSWKRQSNSKTKRKWLLSRTAIASYWARNLISQRTYPKLPLKKNSAQK